MNFNYPLYLNVLKVGMKRVNDELIAERACSFDIRLPDAFDSLFL